MQQITWNDFQKIELIVGTIISAKPFKEAHKPAYIIQADFGPNVGLLKSSAQITTCYQADDLIGQQYQTDTGPIDILAIKKDSSE